MDDWGKPVDPNKVEAALKANPDAKVVAFVHAETSTGAQSDAQTLVKLAHDYGCLTIVDAVTSLAGTPLKVDEWEIDASIPARKNACRASPAFPR
jgi:Serine-pyruvate aminotransferase/archaeal aspartate aminotransferase